MKSLIITAGMLKRITLFVGQTVNENPLTPILGDVIYTISKQRIYAKGTNLNTTLIMSGAYVTTTLAEGDSFTFEYKKLLPLLQSIPEDEQLTIKFKADNKHEISWNYNRSVGKQSFNGSVPTDYPKRAGLGKDPISFDLLPDESQAFIETIRQVSFICEGSNSPNPLHTGFNMRTTGDDFIDSIEFAAHDGLTLAYSRFAIEAQHKTNWDIIVPRSFVPLIIAASNANPGTGINVAFNSRMIQMSFHNAIVCIQLIDETYPPYEKAIPQYEGRFTIRREAILETLKRCLVTASIYESSVILFVKEKGPGMVSMYSQNIELGIWNDETLSVAEDLHSAGELRLCINGRTLVKTVKAMVGDMLTFRFGTTALRSMSCLIQGSDSETNALVMGIDELKLPGSKSLIGRPDATI